MKHKKIDHSINNYINTRLTELRWLDKTLSEKSRISKGQISKLKNGNIDRLTAEIFYKLYTAFGDSCSRATKMVYPHLNLRLNKYTPETRNTFGKFIQQFEESKNSIEEIAAKTGISETRLRNLYFGKGSPEAFELLLIEKALGLKQGELFERLYGEVDWKGSSTVTRSTN